MDWNRMKTKTNPTKYERKRKQRKNKMKKANEKYFIFVKMTGIFGCVSTEFEGNKNFGCILIGRKKAWIWKAHIYGRTV